MVNPASSHDGLTQELLALYDELDREVAAAGAVCQVSGRCCRFVEYGHTLFLSRVEAELLLEQPAKGETQLDEANCPYQVDRLCTARERRPLGCRVYFCNPEYEGKAEEISERYIKRLKELHAAHGREWDYRRLHAHLGGV
jgi:Fe-S-cluster containining protein